MNTSISFSRLNYYARKSFGISVVLCLMVMASEGANKNAGDIADHFEIPNFLVPDEPLNLDNYDGSILVIDFWAYWCPNCKAAMPLYQRDIRDYYRDQGGNAAGIPVSVITISVDNGSMSGVQGFVDTYNSQVVGLANGQAWNQFRAPQGYIPNFTVINCSTTSDNYDYREVVYNVPGYNLSNIRAAIDSVTKALPSYEQWKLEVFTDLERAQPDVIADDSDPDGDGISNLQEYAFKLHPTQHNNNGGIFSHLQSGYLALSYRQNKNAPDIDFIVESTDSLIDGPWLTNGIVEIGRFDSNSYWWVTVQDTPAAQDRTNSYMRLKIIK